MTLKVRSLAPEDWADWSQRVGAMEAGVTYPLGEDRFSIDHGANYFAFFERLGEVHYDVVLDGARVVAVLARVLRTLELGGTPTSCWYLCDLKVHADYRGRRIPTLLAKHSFLRSYARCRRGFALTMNPPAGANRVVRLVQRLPIVPLDASTSVEIFSLDAEQMERAAPHVVQHRGPFGYRSLRGVKDIVLESTGEPMPLLHVQFGPNSDVNRDQLEEGATHMLCSPAGSPLSRALSDQGLVATASATVLSHGMGKTDFGFVLTSEI